jgi:hypothetical protein
MRIHTPAGILFSTLLAACTAGTDLHSISDEPISSEIVSSSPTIQAKGQQFITDQATISKEGPAGLSIELPRDFAPFFTESFEIHPTSTELTLGISGEEYFRDKNLSPNLTELYITLAEQEYSGKSYCADDEDASFYITEKKTYVINGYSFTQINEEWEEDAADIITIANKTDTNTCRYVRIATQSASENVIRVLAAEDASDLSEAQLQLLIANTKASKEYFNSIGEQIAQTVSAK